MGRRAPVLQRKEPRGWRRRNPRGSWSGHGGFHPDQTLHNSLGINGHPAWDLTLTRMRSRGTAGMGIAMRIRRTEGGTRRSRRGLGEAAYNEGRRLLRFP